MGYSAKEIVTVGFTNQRETTIIWDKTTGKAVYNAIGSVDYGSFSVYIKSFFESLVWLDTRTSSMIEEVLQQPEFKEKGKNHFKEICGLPLNPYFSAMKMKWILNNVPNLNEENLLAGTVDTWLLWVYLHRHPPPFSSSNPLTTTTTRKNFTGGVHGGVHATDVTNASRTMLMDLKTLQWDSYVCK